MDKVKWWLRIVGVLYLLYSIKVFEGLINNPEANPTFWGPSISASGLASVLIWLVLAILMFLSSRNPINASSLVKTIALLELFAWIPCDVIFLANGAPVIGGIVLICIHFIVGLSGLVFVKNGPATKKDSIGRAA